MSEGGGICNELSLSFTVDTVISNINIKVRLLLAGCGWWTVVVMIYSTSPHHSYN